MELECPLCRTVAEMENIRGDDTRDYHLCPNCALIFADERHHLSPDEEKARYETHENTIGNEGYVAHLNRIIEPMLAWLDRSMRGLDYGSGPGPAIAQLVRRHGIRCENYDPFFAPRDLHPPYDFIFSTETFEHFHTPHIDIQHVCDLLIPGGILGVMTERWTSREHFATWYYTRDPTHTSFYHEDTFEYISDHFGMELLWMDKSRIALLRKR